MVIQCLPTLDGEPPQIFSSANIQMMLCANKQVVVGLSYDAIGRVNQQAYYFLCANISTSDVGSPLSTTCQHNVAASDGLSAFFGSSIIVSSSLRDLHRRGTYTGAAWALDSCTDSFYHSEFKKLTVQ
jgi:hypothetical protein